MLKSCSITDEFFRYTKGWSPTHIKVKAHHVPSPGVTVILMGCPHPGYVWFARYADIGNRYPLFGFSEEEAVGLPRRLNGYILPCA